MADTVTSRRPGRDATLIAGDLLNGIYKVERFIARGGMGEVFEGVNVETEERVAIKAIRSHLASDPKVVALFRKEARVLTQFAHPAIVQYRVFARDPLIDLHYIVTDFIDGEPITAHLDGTVQDLRDVVILARRLAAGLEVAHDHGAIHRDMSPDNVLLPNGKLERAKIIDFGIAKSLDVVMETVVGDGFAGKLGYVAPEQFGDFGRQVGPWTDVYSTALVLLAYARGKAPGMGTTLSEAVERRRIGPDIIDLPLALAPLIERMLVPDPTLRIRSMREVLAGLEGIRLPDTPVIAVRTTAVPDAPIPPPTAAPAAGTTYPPDSEERRAEPASMTTFVPQPAPSGTATEPADGPAAELSAGPETAASSDIAPLPPRPAATSPAGRGNRRRWTLIAMPVAIAALAGSLAVLRTPEPPAPAPASVTQQRGGGMPRAAARLSAADRMSKFDALLADMPCTWVRARPTTEDGATILSGGTGDRDAVVARLAGNAQALGPVDTRGIRPAAIVQCGAIDVFRAFHAAGTDPDENTLLLSSGQAVLGTGGPGCAGGATVEATAQAYDPERDFALVSLQPDGRLLQIAGSRAEFARLAQRDATRYNIGTDGAYHASICYTLPGPAAIFLIDSKGPIDLGLRTGDATLPVTEFRRRLAEQANRQQIRASADWAWIDNSGLVVPDSAAADASQQPMAGRSPQSRSAPPGRSPRPQRVTDASDANRRELDRLKTLQIAGSGSDTGLCRTFDRSWTIIGQVERSACLAKAFEHGCDVTFAMHKDRLFRRDGRSIEEQRGRRWRPIAKAPKC